MRHPSFLSPLFARPSRLPRFSRLVLPLTLAFMLSVPAIAAADAAGAQSFVEQEQAKLLGLVKKGDSAKAQISQTMDAMVDYSLLARRTFGDPCPKGASTCVNHWKDLTPQQQTEVTDLLRKLVEKNYKKNLTKTADYDVTFKSTQMQGSDARVRTSAKSRTKTREAPYSIDYLVAQVGGGYRVVDIITEGSSLTKNYYEQFHKMLGAPDQGFPHIVKKLKEKLAKP